MKLTPRHIAATTLSAAALLGLLPQKAHADAVTDWNANAGAAAWRPASRRQTTRCTSRGCTRCCIWRCTMR